MNHFRCLLLPLVVVFTINARAQNQGIQSDSLYSNILQEMRPLQILFPRNYNPDLAGGFDILYVTDGISDYLKNEFDWLQWEGFIPKNMIVVGVSNTSRNGVDMRNRDFTPTRTDDVSGGAYNFLQFFKQELIPYISKKYPAKATGHSLSGSSLGGLFVIYSFLNEPGLFTSYIAIDPSLWWDNLYIDKLASEKLPNLKGHANTLYIAGREGQAFKDMGITGIDSLLNRINPVGLRWTCVRLPNETHFSTILKGTWDGLKFSYGGYYASTGGYYNSRNIDYKPMNGIALKDKPFYIYCFNIDADNYIHYTIDGSVPVAASPKVNYRTEISLRDNTSVSLKSLGVREAYNKTASITIKIIDSFPPGVLPRKAKAGGLQYSYYEGPIENLSGIGKKKPVTTGIADNNFDINSMASKEYAYMMKGYIEISKAGYYIFSMGDGNKHARVYINNEVILGNHMKSIGENFMVPLEKGFYPIRIEYLHKEGEPGLHPIYIELEGGDQFPIPASILYSEK